jgi:hypothetical protein
VLAWAGRALLQLRNLLTLRPAARVAHGEGEGVRGTSRDDKEDNVTAAAPPPATWPHQKVPRRQGARICVEAGHELKDVVLGRVPATESYIDGESGSVLELGDELRQVFFL